MHQRVVIDQKVYIRKLTKKSHEAIICPCDTPPSCSACVVDGAAGGGVGACTYMD